jgi:hypothetical protein
MNKLMAMAGLAAMLVSPAVAQLPSSTTAPATNQPAPVPAPVQSPVAATDLSTTPLSFDLNAVPAAETLPPPLDPNARPRTTRSEPASIPVPVTPEGGYSRSLRTQPSQPVAAATPPTNNGQRCERTPSGGTRCTTVLLQSNSVDGQRVAAELDEQSARLEAQVQRELDRLSNPPPR